MMPRFALGTAQFGFAYGVSNTTGAATSPDEIGQILDYAKLHGIDTLDTAIAYGNAETALGQFDLKGFAIITKLPELPINTVDVKGWVMQQIELSLKRLGVNHIKSVLLHRPNDLFGNDGLKLAHALGDLVGQNIAEQIGVSVYSCKQLDRCRDVIPVNLAQIPFNVLDNTLAQRIETYRHAGVNLHTRSAFLQGLLLMSQGTRDLYFDRWAEVFQQWHDWLATNDITATAACLNYVRSQSGIDRLVIGVQTLAQLQELLAIPRSQLPPLPIWSQEITGGLTNPAKWALQ